MTPDQDLGLAGGSPMHARERPLHFRPQDDPATVDTIPARRLPTAERSAPETPRRRRRGSDRPTLPARPAVAVPRHRLSLPVAAAAIGNHGQRDHRRTPEVALVPELRCAAHSRLTFRSTLSVMLAICRRLRPMRRQLNATASHAWFHRGCQKPLCPALLDMHS